MIKIRNKKADEGGGSLIGLIITIALIVIAALVILFFFTRGTGGFGDFIRNILGANTVGSVVNGCKTACNPSLKEDYCNQIRTLKFEDKATFIGSCYTLLNSPVSGERLLTSGAEECSQILSCEGYNLKTCDSTSLADSFTEPEKTTHEAKWISLKCPIGSKDLTSMVQDSQGKDITKNKCCKVEKTAQLCTAQAGEVSGKAVIVNLGSCPLDKKVPGIFTDITADKECCKTNPTA